MARDDTRLHRLEAMVAGLLAWQNVAEKLLVAREVECKWLRAQVEDKLCTFGYAGQIEARVAALEQQRDGRPAPAQAAYRDWACDECTKGVWSEGEWSRCKGGRCNIDKGGIDFCPKQAAQPANCHGQCSECAAWQHCPFMAEDQPAPQQPRSCATCACEPGSIECEGCTPGLPLGWQPRGGGG